MAAKRDLLEGSDEESSEPITIKVNEQYARRYEHNKKREDLHRLQELQKQGLISDDEADSEEEDEDEDGRLPVRTEVRIFDTLAKIKKKDPEIYKEGVKFFEEEEDDGESDEEPENAARSSKRKPIYLKDVVGQGAESDEDDEQPRSFKTYAEEQQELKDAVLKGIEDADISDEEEGFLKVKKKSKQELENAEAEDEAEKKSSVVTRTLEEYFGKDDSLDENDRFLKNFLLNEGWVEKDKGLPSYEDVVGGISEDEEEIDRQEQYEAAYNFRFEEKAGSQVAGHSRIVENSVRKLPEKRKEQRKHKQERLLEAEAARREEVKRLKNLKKKEIMDKMSKIKSVAGMEDLVKIAEDDLEEDFDPDEYDKKMKEAFGDDYYEQEDPDFHSDQDVDELVKPDLGGSGTEEIERNAKQELEKKMEEYYKLDYEDMVGDLPTRFKYTQVKPDMYGLTAAQILDSDDKELNQYISLKFLAPYRTDEPLPRHKHYRLTKKERKRKALDQTPAITKKQNEDNQPSTGQSPAKNSQQAKKKQKTQNINEQQQSTSSTGKQQNAETEQQEKVDAQQENQKKKRRRRKKGLGLSESRLISYGKIQLPKRRKN